MNDRKPGSDPDRSDLDLDDLVSQLASSPEYDEEDPTPDDSPEAILAGSPTLLTLDEARRPNPMPVCGPCPHSMWFAYADGLKCYCRLMHAVTWSDDEPQAIVLCDGVVLSE